MQKETQKALTQARWDYINNTLLEGLENNNSKPFWRFVKSRRQDNVGVAPLQSDGVVHTDSKDKAQIFNRQFQKVFTQEGDEPMPDPAGPSFPSIGSLEIHAPGVAKLLSALKVNKASGPDDLPCHMLKELAVDIAPVLTFIFNQSLTTGKLPPDWVKANVAPIFKKGNTNLAENYRPVSLTSVCCKVLEHIVLKHMLTHFESHSILTSLQHGFRAAHSCVTQLVTTVQDLMCFRDSNVQVDIIVLDFSKAFDTVPHNRLLHKLHHYGIRGELHTWLAAFLKSRYQRVVVDGVHAEWVHVDSGVPQGTVLGPLLFLAHINDLPSAVRSHCRLFADDCLLYRPIRTLQDQLDLQVDLDRLQEWAKVWGMRFNASKCQVLRISRSARPLDRFYTIGDHILDQVTSAKYLGVIINDQLQWDTHIDSITARANRTIGFLRRNLALCPQSLKELAYLSLTRSILEYACQVWDPHKKTDQARIEQVQRRAARFTLRDYSSYSSVTAMLKTLGWESLTTRRKNARLALMYQITFGLVAIPTDTLTPADTRTRASHDYKYRHLAAATKPYQNSFFPKNNCGVECT